MCEGGGCVGGKGGARFAPCLSPALNPPTDLSRRGLGRLDALNECDVVQNISLYVGEAREQPVLKLEELHLVGLERGRECLLRLLKVWSLRAHHLGQQLGIAGGVGGGVGECWGLGGVGG